ncbi:AraC family transcriptional regulator [Actinokineospora sp. NBRC 105648]|uniref:AraC family transcriptional regulator n=1 Tax=Actinokineospora sp. NBRC 105648 TaxID=3032206 RepID=UPI00249FDC56|nr:AraC family transcriptional regulator [Actinokineospora sp. NBRC 105648]GLZ42512.1 AraC family transcriptional regulator [Actinokineospora sp. NBRC 105648]
MTVHTDEDDLLSELLRPIRLTGVFHSWWLLRTPWSIEGDSESTCAVLHYIAEGSCWISADGVPPTHLQQGDLAIFPTGVAHRMSDQPDRVGTPLRALLAARAPGASDRLVHGGDGAQSRVLCAGLHFDASAASSLYRALPWMMVLERERVEREPLLRDVINLLVAYQGGDVPGSQVITLRAFEMAFVLTLRPLLGGMMERPEVLAALQHPGISKALLIMYTRFAEPWTIESLAREVGMSRSAFTASFRELVGEGPARHLASHRMRESARLLAESSIPQSALPQRVGYKSAVGFHLAFRKCFDMTPGEYRQSFQRTAG